jgi:hypothetical protein
VVSYRLKVEFDNEIMDMLAKRGSAPLGIASQSPEKGRESDQGELFKSFKGAAPEASFGRKTEESKEKPDSKIRSIGNR